MAFKEPEESKDIVDWEWLDSQPDWFRKDVIKGKQKPKYKVDKCNRFKKRAGNKN